MVRRIVAVVLAALGVGAVAIAGLAGRHASGGILLGDAGAYD